MTSVPKRSYRRRTEDERIRELEEKIQELQNRTEAKKTQEKAKKKQHSAVMREIPRIRKRLQRFSQLAMDKGRLDVANTVTAFLVSLGRIYDEEVTEEVHWSEPLPADEED
jgi:TolA-binding protein